MHRMLFQQTGTNLATWFFFKSWIDLQWPANSGHATEIPLREITRPKCFISDGVPVKPWMRSTTVVGFLRSINPLGPKSESIVVN